MSQGIRNGACAAAVLVGMFGIGAAQAQGITQRTGTGATSAIPAIEDWSTRTRIQGKPLYPDEFEASGRLADMQALYTDPRYVAGVLRRVEGEGLRQAPSRAIRAGGEATATSDRRRGHGSPGSPGGTADPAIVRDWSNVLGGGNGGNAALGMYPAKYNFDIFAAPSCANDFVVYGTNAPGATDTLNTREQWTGTFSATNSTTGTITLGYGGGRSITLTASTADNTGSNFQVASGTDDTVRDNKANNLVLAINRWTSTTGIVADRPGGTGAVRLTSLASGPQNFTVSQTGNGAGFTLFTQSTNGTGTPGQPTIIAYNQLYQGTCNGSWNQNGAVKAPNVMWAYNTSTIDAPNAIVETSPVLSYFDNGKQVAFIQRAGNNLQLVLLKWQAGAGTASTPAVINPVADGTAYRACAGNCFYAISLNGMSNSGSGPTYSSPYVDYAADVLWVGDGYSRLHKFTGIFEGIPAEVTAGGFPVAVSATTGLDLSPPVADENFVYVGSQSGAAGIGGMVHRVPVGGGTVVSSAKLSADNRSGFRAAMILDSSTNRLYSFVFSRPGTPTSNTQCQHQGGAYVYCRAVVQFDTTNFTEGGTGIRMETGLGSITGEAMALWTGSFDDAYYASGTGTGALYVCGGNPTRTQQTRLWKVPVVNGVLQAAVPGPQIGVDDNDTDTTIYNCSPPTVIKNGSNEYLFVSVSGAAPTFATAPGCGAATDTNALSACMYMFQLNNLDGDGTPNEAGDSAWGTANNPRAMLPTPGGTGGIVVDNVTSPNNTTVGGQQMYYGQAGTTGNAVQASQSGLQ